MHNSFGKFVRDGLVGVLALVTLTPQVARNHLKKLKKIEQLTSCDTLDDNRLVAGTPPFDASKLPNERRGKPK